MSASVTIRGIGGHDRWNRQHCRYYGDHLIFATDPKRHSIDVDDILVVIGPRAELEKLRRDLKQEKE